MYIKYLMGSYKSSKYNTVVENGDNEYLLHNQITNNLIMLDKSKYEQYEKIQNKNLVIDIEFLNFLIDRKFLISSKIDELEIINKVWEKTTNDQSHKGLTIVTTDRCNLGCHYCYEAKSAWQNMTLDTQEKLKTFIDTYLRSSKTDSLKIVWFGGEPTLNLQCIENISKFVINICKELNIKYSPFAVTNGTTLTKDVVKKLKECNVNQIQITVDGLKEYHDKLRPYLRDLEISEMNKAQIEQRKKIDSKFSLNVISNNTPPKQKRSSFDAIMKGIENCYEAGIHVSLRINMNDSNKHSVPAFKRMIEEKGWTTKNELGGFVAPYTHAIFQTSCGNCPSMSIEEQAFQELKTQKYTPSLKLTGGTCTANKNHQFVVNSSGAIVKCWHHATDDTHAIETIDNLDIAIKGTGEVDKYKFNPMLDEECRSCHVLPICLGGCKQNNKFDTEGYKGKKYEGCNTIRWTIKEQIKNLYNDIVRS